MNKDMAAFFDNLAPKWGDNLDEFKIREKFVAMTELSQNSVIADIGCGKGVMFPHLLKTNPAKIIAVDISGEMLRLAKQNCNDSRFVYINGDVLNAPLPALDVAIIFNAYPHLMNKKALAEKLAKAVKQNGKVVIAHSRSRAQINSVHDRNGACNLSVPLESAETEAKKFMDFFVPDTLIDNNEFYFLKLRRI